MVNDPCNIVPDTNIPSGLSLHRHHAVHHVVGRIKHSIHHKFPIAGPSAPAPTPFGCEKHAILPPRPGGNGIVGPGAAAPLSKFAALGGAGAGLVALGGLGGAIGGIIPIHPAGKVNLAPPPTKVVTTNPGPPTLVPPTGPTPPTTPVTPVVPIIPGTPPVAVPEPSTLVVFVFAVAMMLAMRHFRHRRPQEARVTAA